MSAPGPGHGVPPVPYGQAPPPAHVGHGFRREMAHAVRETVEEISVWVAAVLVVVGLPGLIGYLVADGTGMLVGAVGGALVLGVVWVVLLVKSISLAGALLRRHR